MLVSELFISNETSKIRELGNLKILSIDRAHKINEVRFRLARFQCCVLIFLAMFKHTDREEQWYKVNLATPLNFNSVIFYLY